MITKWYVAVYLINSENVIFMSTRNKFRSLNVFHKHYFLCAHMFTESLLSSVTIFLFRPAEPSDQNLGQSGSRWNASVPLILCWDGHPDLNRNMKYCVTIYRWYKFYVYAWPKVRTTTTEIIIDRRSPCHLFLKDLICLILSTTKVTML